MLIGAVIATAVGSGVSFWALGLYIKPLEAEFGWSRAEVTAGFSISLLAAGLAGPLIGKWVDIRGPRSAIIIGAVLTAAAYLLLAMTRSLWQWYAFLTINAVVRNFMFYIPFQALISRWFSRRRGLAIALFNAGFALGGTVVVPLMRIVIDTVDWDGSFVFSSIVTLAFYLPVGVFIIRNRPEDVGAGMDGDPFQKAEAGVLPAPLPGLTPGQAIRTPMFWIIALALASLFYGMFGWLVHQVPYYESVGVSRSTAAAIVSLVAGCNFLARLTFGVLIDRIRNVEPLGMALLLFLMAGMTTLIIGSAGGIPVFIVFWAIGTGGAPLLEPLLLTRAFGVAHFATILGLTGAIETMGQILSPTIAGAIFDSTGSYDWVLVMYLSTFVLAFGLLFLATRLRRPLIPQAGPERVVAAA